uniref:Nuclear receptor n=1 Tax=Parastrongyloides trichosuri TaxID=131310 RepID=A0A0N4Z105_PARTI
MSNYNIEEEILCLICSYKATGIHYGVMSCNGCKTFFRRSIVKQKIYSCLGLRNCDITKRDRYDCKSCRFDKCIKVGMNREAIQSNRDKIGYTQRGYKKSPKSEDNSECSTINYCNVTNEDNNQYLYHQQVSTSKPNENCSIISGFTYDNIKIFKSNIRKLKKLEDTFTLLLTRGKIEEYSNLNIGLMSPSIFNKPLNISYLDAIVEPTIDDDKYKVPFWRKRIITLYVDWAKTFSTFSRLPHSDKICLITNHASSYIAMCEAFRTPEHISDKIEHPDGHSFTLNFPEIFKKHPSLNTLTPAMRLVFDFVYKPFRRINITTTEFAILQSIMLFDPDTNNLGYASQRNIMAEQKKHINTLLFYISKCYVNEDVVNERFADIILRIPTIRKVAIKVSESLEFTDMFNCYKISSIVKETSLPDHNLIL